MNLNVHYEYFVSLLSAVVAMVLLFVHRERSLSPRILAFYFVCVSYMVFFYALVRYGDFVQFPHLWRTSVFVGALNPVLSFIYVRSVLEQRYWFRRSDILLLSLPFLLALTFLEFYVQPASVKQLVIREALADKRLYQQENEGLLPPGFSLLIRILFGISLVAGQALLLYRWYRHKRPSLPENPQNMAIFRWLVFFTGAIAFTFLLTAVQHFSQLFQSEDFYWISSMIVMVAVVSALTYLFLRPNILYGLHGWAKPEPAASVPLDVHEEGKPREFVGSHHAPAFVADLKPSPRRSNISVEYGEQIREKVETHIRKQQPFLRRGYTIANLSAEIGVPLYQLSAFINQQYGQSFNEFINGYRIQYIKEVLLKEPGADQYTLEAMGKKAGFNSRSTFIAAVKKQTGQTPSSFLLSKEMH